MTRSETVLIVGSINMDLVVRVPHVPALGETVLGRDFSSIPGGKGANQAVAAARLCQAEDRAGHAEASPCCRAALVGRVGADGFGETLLAGLDQNGVDCTLVRRTPGVASGVAMIVVEEGGDNAIAVASGANFAVTPADIDAAESAIRAARVCVLQLELPMETVVHAIAVCRRHGVETILDPAPAPTGPVPDEVFQADILSPNETEAAQLTGLPLDTAPDRVAAALHQRGSRHVLLKLGSQGTYVSSAGSEGTPGGGVHIPAHHVKVVDTTAAGDAFTGALAVARARGWLLADAARFANAAGALACTRWGAQPSMPTLAEVEALRQQR